ncbi:MAG: FUSC family protein [Nevskia sp.]|nr:FUSC family protein [Nevskia sp.]
MPAPAAPAAPWRAGLRAALREWAGGEGRAWIFVFKTALAALLALWLAMRLGLDSPRSALLTVVIVAQPASGMVLAKSFYRTLGTLAGCLGTFLLVGLFAQQRELFLGAMALWVGLCTAGAARYRNFQAYAFILAGYTTCLIGFPATLNPPAVFDIAVTRVSEVMLGILCAGVVADLVLPQRLGATLVATVRGRYKDFLGFVTGALRGRLDRGAQERAHARFVADIVAFEAQRDAAYFESPDARVRSGRLRLLNAEFMSATTSIHTLGQHMQRLRTRGAGAAPAALAPLYEALADALLPPGAEPPAMAAEAAPVVARLERFLDELPARAAQARGALEPTAGAEALLDFDSAAELLRRFCREMRDYTESYAALAQPGTPLARPAPSYVPHTDLATALLSGVRATAALLAVSVFWIASAWPYGAGAATLACVVCCLFAAAPAPLPAVRAMGLGFLGGLAAAFACAFFVLPHLDGFALLAAGLLPFLMLGLKLAAAPRTALLGTGFNIMFASAVNLENHMRFDPAALLNDGFAALFGVLVAGLAFALLVPPDSPRLRRHLLRRLRAQILLACFGALAGLRHRFENSTRDLLSQLVAGSDPAGPGPRRLLGLALSVLETGHAVIDLRGTLADASLPQQQRAACRACLRRLAQFFERPVPARRLRALDSLALTAARVDAMLAFAPQGAGSDALRRARTSLHVLRILLLDDETCTVLSAVEDPAAVAPSTGAFRAA